VAQLPTDEQQFIAGVSAQTGIDPRVLVAWIQQEGAYAPGGTGGHNYLNLRPDPASDVGVSSVSPGRFDQFATVQDAIASTVARLKQPFAAPILSAAKSHASPAQEIGAIASTGWDADHYGGSGGPNLQATFAQLFGQGQLGSAYQGSGSAAEAAITGNIPTNIGKAEKAISGAAGSFGDLFSFLTSWRFAEVVGGALLLLVGLVLLGRQFGVQPPVRVPVG
jgi:hypothetical protein